MTIQENKPTTLTLNEKTKKELAEFGKKGDSFDKIIQNVMSDASKLCNKASNEKEDDVVSPTSKEENE